MKWKSRNKPNLLFAERTSTLTEQCRSNETLVLYAELLFTQCGTVHFWKILFHASFCPDTWIMIVQMPKKWNNLNSWIYLELNKHCRYVFAFISQAERFILCTTMWWSSISYLYELRFNPNIRSEFSFILWQNRLRMGCRSNTSDGHQ